MQWSDFSNLTPVQRNFFAQMEALGNSLRQRPPPNPVPTHTLAQAKRAVDFLNEVNALIRPAIEGARYTAKFHRKVHAQSLEDANP